MNEIIETENTKIANMICEIRDKQVMLDSEISRPECHNHLYDKIVTYYDIDEPISILNNFITGDKIIWN